MMAMFGTIFSMRPKPGQEQAVEQLFHSWERDRRPNVAGVVGGYLFKSRSNPGELTGVAIFDSEESYSKNANDPAQNGWYQQLRDKLQADPEWNDGEVIAGG